MESIAFNWAQLLPPYLTSSGKDRLKQALEQFAKHSQGNKQVIDYTGFYWHYPGSFLYQGDLMHSISCPIWDIESKKFETVYTPAVLLSNSCDASDENKRNIPKDLVFAPVIPLEEFENDLKSDIRVKDKAQDIIGQIRRQLVSNLFYLPHPDSNKDGFIAFLDRAFSIPIKAIQNQMNDLSFNRFQTLSNFGSYLLIVKLSFHFCRVPEEVERMS